MATRHGTHENHCAETGEHAAGPARFHRRKCNPEGDGGKPDAEDRLIDRIRRPVSVVPEAEWSRGSANGVCRYPNEEPVVEVVNRENEADLASTLVHEYAHALLHEGVECDMERAKREVEAESTAYVVGRACGLDMTGSAFYLAVWGDDELDMLRERVVRISRTAGGILSTLEDG